MRQEKIVEMLNRLKKDHFDLESLTMRSSIYNQVFSENEEMPQPVRYALALKTFLGKKPVVMSSYDILAGLIQHYDVSASMPVNYDDNYDPRILPIYTRSTDVPQIIERCLQFLEKTEETESTLDLLERGTRIGLYAHNPYGHVIPGFFFFAKNGIVPILEMIENNIANYGNNKNDRTLYLNAMKVAVEGLALYLKRYAKKAEALSKTVEDDAQKANLKRIQESCLRLSEGPAESFFDVVQLVTVMQEVLTIETASGSMSLGRLDQLFYPYYEKDKKAGRIDEAEAQCIIDAWRIKLAGLIQGFQNLTICGCDKDHRFAGNAVSKMILRSTREYRFDQPLLSMRYTHDTPEDFWEDALRIIELGDGFPAMFNDDIIIPSRIRMGVAAEDAWDYGMVGCVEPSIQGKEFSNTEEMRINWLKVLELMLQGETCLYSEEAFPLREKKPLNTIEAFEDLVGWFKQELEHAILLAAKGCMLVERAYYKCFPSPFLSSTVAGCVEQGCDVSDSTGARYRFSTINNCGMSNVVDSLLAIKAIVFDKKALSLEDFAKVLKDDFNDHEELRLYAVNHCEKFGNGSQAAEDLMKELIEFATQKINGIKNERGFHFQTGMYSVDQHASFGQQTGASAEGRKAWTSLANGLSPVQGADKSGPTAVINSITAFDHVGFGNGMVLDLKFSPSIFSQQQHRAMFHALMKTYFAKGGMEIQFNVVNKKDLIEAQQVPAKYQNLIVRVSGFSAYFVNLYKTLQDEIIERTENDTV